MGRPALLLVPLFLAACSDQSTPPVEEAQGATLAASQAPFLHVVHVGGQDICALFGLPLGCDGNFSLVAFQWPDGSITGSWTDGPFGGNLVVDCLDVVGDVAWIGGVDRANPREQENRWISRVVDAGRSTKDPPDSVSRRWFVGTESTGNPALCRTRPPNLVRFVVATMTGVPQGQVQVQ
jgi:hypothetical protein